LALLEAGPYDVIVTDMRMPEIDGAKLLEQVQERYPGVVRIVLSGHVELDAALRVAPIAHQFLTKPCDPEKLRAAIERACESRAMFSDEDTRRVIGSVGRLPALPSTCASLFSALQDPEVNLAQVVKIVEQDVAITAKVLQLVNSAFFGLRNEVTSVHAAVNYLGLDTLKQLVLTVEIFRTFQPAPIFGFSLTGFEVHSQLAAHIASRLPLPQRIASTAIVAALLHDTGKLVLASRLPARFELALRTAFEKNVPLHTVEEELTGTSHAQVGACLLDLWGLPKSIVEAAGAHHRPAAAPPPGRELNILAATHIADALANELGETAAEDASPACNLLDEDYVAALGMTDRLPAWRAAARQIFEEEI
jgi:HD-like signal output (HDOD) protein